MTHLYTASLSCICKEKEERGRQYRILKPIARSQVQKVATWCKLPDQKRWTVFINKKIIKKKKEQTIVQLHFDAGAALGVGKEIDTFLTRYKQFLNSQKERKKKKKKTQEPTALPTKLAMLTTDHKDQKAQQGQPLVYIGDKTLGGGGFAALSSLLKYVGNPPPPLNQ